MQKKIRKQYYNLAELYKKSTCNCKIMCQRQYHMGYKYIKDLLKETGFKTLGVFDDMSFSSPKQKSQRLYFVAKRK